LASVRHNGGFTLIEVVACIVIMAVLAAIAGPKFFDQQPFAARGYTAEVVAAIRGARQIAVSSQCDVLVTLDPNTGYRVTQRSVFGNPCTGAFTTPVRLTDGNPLANVPPSGVLLAPATQILFRADGSTAAAVPALTVGAFKITVDSRSGYVGK
jgi:MSHA pilin protein MshC